MNDATENPCSGDAGRLPDGDAATLAPEAEKIVRAVTVIMGTVVGLTFMFGFGNVLTLALRLGVPVWVAPLVAPAVDLSILGLLLGTRHLALAGVSPDVLRPARRLLIFASVVTLALNVAEPLVAGQYGKAAFDAVGPLLLIGWSEVGPGLLQAVSTTRRLPDACGVDRPAPIEVAKSGNAAPEAQPQLEEAPVVRRGRRPATGKRSPEELLAQARRQDADHRAAHQKPISADTMRARLGVGAACARRLVKIVRSEFDQQAGAQRLEGDGRGEPHEELILAA